MGSMSKKRNPLLSDEAMSGVVTFPGGGKRYEHEMAGDEVRDYYEHLITEGKLRAVEDVEFVKWRHASSDLMLDTECGGCGFESIADERGNVPSDRWKFCPNCGNKINR